MTKSGVRETKKPLPKEDMPAQFWITANENIEGQGGGEQRCVCVQSPLYFNIRLRGGNAKLLLYSASVSFK
jgi:hypothetical protein